MPETEGKAKTLISLTAHLGENRRRVSSENQRQRDLALETEGWQRRFVADAERAREAVELYRQLGFEILLEPLQTVEADDECRDCQLMMQLAYKTIYTRKRVNDDDPHGNT